MCDTNVQERAKWVKSSQMHFKTSVGKSLEKGQESCSIVLDICFCMRCRSNKLHGCITELECSSLSPAVPCVHNEIKNEDK